MSDSKEYQVVLMIPVTTNMLFSDCDPDTITVEDAIENVIGSIPDCVLNGLHGEGFGIGQITGMAFEI